METKPTFEQRLETVKELIERIESGKLPLEESVRQFENGMKALNELEKELDEMKRTLTVLQEQPDGSAAEKPLEVNA